MENSEIYRLVNSGGGADFRETLKLLAGVSQSFSSSPLSLEETLHRAVSLIKQYTHAEAASLFMLENSGRELVCRVCVGPINITGLRLDANSGIVGRTVRENQVQLIRQVSDDPDFATATDKITGFHTRSILCAPLCVNEHRIGTLEILNKKSGDGLFDDRDRCLVEVLAAPAALAIHSARMTTALLQQERLRKELELAREIQESLLPSPDAAGAPIYGVNRPALEVSGDFFDWARREDGSFMFSIGDVSGKGMNAALLMAKTSSLLHCLCKTCDRPADLMNLVNRELCESATRGMFVTALAGIYQPRTGRVRWANAGHPPPLLSASNLFGEEIERSTSPLGISPDTRFTEVEITLGEDTLFFFTDGLTEGFAEDGRPLGTTGLRTLLRRFEHLGARGCVDAIVTTLTSGPNGLRDDLTMLVIDGRESPAERLPSGGRNGLNSPSGG